MITNETLPDIAQHERLVDDTISAATAIATHTTTLPERARVVVIGGGIIGSSVAAHLAENGISDVVVVERHRLTSGTTWHAAGLFATVRGTHALTELARHSATVYSRLAEQSGVDNGFNRRGCIAVARRPERMIALAYSVSMAHHHGMEAERLSPDEIVDCHPLVERDGLVGGVLYAGDGTVNPGWSALGLAKVAADAGARIVEGTAVERLETSGGRVVAVATDRGRIECESAVVCAGLWSASLVRGVGVSLPVYAAEHVWAMTEPVDAPVWAMPFVRDLDGHVYVRGYRDRLLTGAFEPNGRPRALATIGDEFEFGEFEFDHEHVAPSMRHAQERLPVLGSVNYERHMNAPESFTPDHLPIVGEAPEVAGLFVAAGMNSQGIIFGPGVGRAIAEWIANGAATMDVAELAPGRFGRAQMGSRYLHERTRESLGRLYAMPWPDLQPDTARGLRRSPLHERVEAAGAVFGEVAGWERANWYAAPGQRAEYRYSFDRPSYFENVAREHRAAREAVALFDLSSFAKIEVDGPGALATVQTAFAADLDVAVGKVVYTTMLNARGGVEVDLTVTRLAEDRFLAVAPAITQRAVSARVGGHDLTAALATLAVMGPRSRQLLSGLTDDDLGNEAFPFGTAREIDLGLGPMLALRVSFVGELGWEIYPPADLAVAVHEVIVAAGSHLGLRHAGYHALDTLRSEKGYRHWPHDVGPVDTPIDAGLAFTVGWNKPGFVGRTAVLAAREAPRTRRVAYLRLKDAEPLLRQGDSVRLDGKAIGRVTSGAYGHHLGCAVGLVMLEQSDVPETVTVDIAGRLVAGELSRRPFYDPDSTRLVS
jgi:4-methylaminobutanoate oxidase (formaldehyde-forming)